MLNIFIRGISIVSFVQKVRTLSPIILLWGGKKCSGDTCMNAAIVEKDVEVRELRPATQLMFDCLGLKLFKEFLLIPYNVNSEF